MQVVQQSLWLAFDSLVTAFAYEMIPNQVAIGLPQFAGRNDLNVIQYLFELTAVLWQGKQWSPLTLQLVIETLPYFKNEIYRWNKDQERNKNYPIGERIHVLAEFLEVLQHASLFQFQSNNPNCQKGLEEALLRLRLAMNMWALNVEQKGTLESVHTVRNLIQTMCQA